MSSKEESNLDTVVRKRQRGANYTAEEKNVLLHLINQEKHILECKKTNAVTWREKEEGWNRVAAKFNSVCPANTYRTTESLRKFYENHKKITRRRTVAQEKASFRGTGGGSGYFVKDPTTEITLALMNENTVIGFHDPFDCDSKNNEEVQLLLQQSSSCGASEETEVEIKENNIADVDPLGEAGTSRQSQHDWGNYTPQALRQPVSDKLRRKKTSESSSTDEDGVSSKTWTSRRRPTSSTLSISNVKKQHTELSAIKLELARSELDAFKTNMALKQEREQMEAEARRKALELDIQIKQEILERIKKLNDSEFVKLALGYLGNNK